MLKRILIGLLLATTVAHANDGWYAAGGNAEPFGKSHPHIQMKDEHIRVTAHKDGFDVRVDFTFVNHGPTTRVTMGFPERRSIERERGIRDIRSWVDGRLVKLTKKETHAEENDYRAVWLKDVSFAKGQRRKVRVVYKTGGSGSVMGISGLDYILKTGTSWRGPIEKCTIDVDWSRDEKMSKPEFRLPHGAAKQQIITLGPYSRRFILTDLRPRSDFWLSQIPGFWNFTLNGTRVPLAATGYGSYPAKGSASDPLIAVPGLGYFFGTWEEDNDWGQWNHSSVKERTISSKGGVLTIDGKSLKLRRGVRKYKPQPWMDEPIDYVYLRDVIRLLGGRVRYITGERRLDIVLK